MFYQVRAAWAQCHQQCCSRCLHTQKDERSVVDLVQMNPYLRCVLMLLRFSQCPGRKMSLFTLRGREMVQNSRHMEDPKYPKLPVSLALQAGRRPSLIPKVTYTSVCPGNHWVIYIYQRHHSDCSSIGTIVISCVVPKNLEVSNCEEQ